MLPGGMSVVRRFAVSTFKNWAPSPTLATGSNATQYISNPWPGSDVVIECHSIATNTWDTATVWVWGIIELESADKNGVVSQTVFGDITNLNNLQSILPTRRYVRRLVSVTLAAVLYNVSSTNWASLWQWSP